MRIAAVCAVLLASACSPNPALDAPAATEAAATTHPLHQVLDGSVPAWLEEFDVPSAAVAFLENGDIAFTVAYGEQAPGVPADDNTLYNVASVTKAVVAETILRAASAGALDLNAPMASAFTDPDLADDPRAEVLTPALALSHRTGFAENWRSDMPDGKLAIALDPGTRSHYSGENFQYIANYVAAATGKRIDELTAEIVLQPLGMSHAAFTPQPNWDGHVAMVRTRDGEYRLPDRGDTPSAADDMHATVGDFARFLRSAMRAEGLTPELVEARGTIYDDQVAQACPEGVIPADLCPEHTGFGLGWMIYDSGDNRFFVHNGKDDGERAIILFEPEKQYAVAVFTSGANGRHVISKVLQTLVPDEKLNALVAAEARFDR